MVVCETCWERAQLDAFLRGGHAADHYQRRISEPVTDGHASPPKDDDQEATR